MEEYSNTLIKNSVGESVPVVNGGGLMLGEMPEDENLSYRTPEPAKGGWYVVNVSATGNLGIEYYSGHFTTYRLSPSGIYIFNFYEVQ